MARALRPYPGLDPALYAIVDRLDAAFPEPQEDLPVETFRARLDAISQGQGARHAPGLDVTDHQIAHAGRTVRLRFYRPAGWAEGGPAMLYMHGGGWMLGSIEGHDQVTSDLAADTGMLVVSLDYALAPEHPYPAALNEAMAAFDWLRSGASPLGRIGALWVGGDSAGGNLALALCLKRRDIGAGLPHGQLLIYPCTAPDFSRPSYTTQANAPFLSTTLMLRFWDVYLDGAEPDTYAAPAWATDLSGLPQAVVLTVALDPLVDEGDAIAADLAAAGVPVRHDRVPDLIHGFLRFRADSARACESFAWICTQIREAMA